MTVTVADAQALEAAYDLILPRVEEGARERELPDGYAITFRTEDPAWLAGLDWAFGEAPAGGWTVAGRVHVRRAEDPPAPENTLDVVVASGGFGTSGHPTTRACLELLLDVPATGAFSDLGCGNGVLAAAARALGFAPVLALDADAGAVAAAREIGLNARRADLLTEPLPQAPTAAANVPLTVHERLARDLTVDTLIAAGFDPGRELLVESIYEYGGLHVRGRAERGGWTALLLGR